MALSHQDCEFLRDRLDLYSGLAGTNFRGFIVGAGVAARSGGHPVIVLSDFLWRRDFGADPGIVGTTLHVNNVPMTVIARPGR